MQDRKLYFKFDRQEEVSSLLAYPVLCLARQLGSAPDYYKGSHQETNPAELGGMQGLLTSAREIIPHPECCTVVHSCGLCQTGSPLSSTSPYL